MSKPKKKSFALVSIAKDYVDLKVYGFPYLCYVDGYKPFERDLSRERIEYLAARRNAAVQATLDKFPDTTHICMVDTHYFEYRREIVELIHDYKKNAWMYVILGASTWFRDNSRIPTQTRFFDSWTTPEFKGLMVQNCPEGWKRVKAVGGLAIFPVWLWMNRHFCLPDKFPEGGCEWNGLCANPSAEVNMNMSIKVFHPTPEEVLNRSLVQRVRTTIGAKILDV